MKLMVQTYGTGGYNAEEEETAFLHYAPTHWFDASAEVTITLKDPTGLMAQKYIVDLKKDLAGGVADDGGVETDETTETNSAAANDMTLMPAVPVLNDAFYFGFDEEVGSLTLNVGTAAANVDVIWEYSKGADAWDALADVTDNTTGLTVTGANTISWTLPGDWATDEVGSITGKYWVRVRVTNVPGEPTAAVGTQAWYDKVWIGPCKVVIEDPTATDFFLGRIMSVEANTDARTLTLYCQDWLSQLDEEQITYDMREPLSGNIRESTGHADPDGAFVDVAQNDGGTFYFFDDDMAWANDAYNGMYLIFTSAMAGKKKWTFHPYQATVSDGVTGDGDPDDLWLKDNTAAVMFKNADWTVDYDFRVYLGHDTPSDFYVHTSLTGARIICFHKITVVPSTNHAHIQVLENDGPSYIDLEHLVEDDTFHQDVHEIDITNLPNIVSNTGIVRVRYDVDRAGGNATLSLTYLAFEIDVETTGYSSAVLINDTIATNKLEVATDLTAAATRVWERIPYCIAKPIYKHIDSAEGGTLITGGDDLVTLTCAATIEHTSGISTRQYVGKTRLQVAQDLARQDRAHLWMALGTTILTYKSTFNDGAPETLTDTDVNSWTSRRDYSTLANEVTSFGMRIGNNRLSSTYTDTTSEATFGTTRTKVTNDTGLVSEHDTLARATALVNQYKDIQQILTCTIRGNTAKASHDKTLVLGDEVSITSSLLGLSSAVYIVQRWSYDSNPNVNLTTLLLHPRVSQVGLQKDERPSFEMMMQDFRRGTADRYVPAPESKEVA